MIILGFPRNESYLWNKLYYSFVFVKTLKDDLKNHPVINKNIQKIVKENKLLR